MSIQVGCARLGSSGKACHPKTFFGADTVASVSPPAAVAGYEIFDTTGAFDN